MKIIVNADDFGASNSTNEAIDYAFRNGIIDRTTIMVTSPECEDAMQKAFEGGYYGSVGLHLHLDGDACLSENLKSYGLSNPSFWRNSKNRFLIFDAKLRKALKEEIEAQMQRYIELGCTLMHIDSHHHRHLDVSILVLVIPLAKKYGFKSMRISRNVGPGLSGVKGFLKKLINKSIRRQFQTTDYFCSYGIFQTARFDDNKSVEIMVHPVKQGNQYIDLEFDIKNDKYNTLDSLSFE